MQVPFHVGLYPAGIDMNATLSVNDNVIGVLHVFIKVHECERVLVALLGDLLL